MTASKASTFDEGYTGSDNGADDMPVDSAKLNEIKDTILSLPLEQRLGE